MYLVVNDSNTVGNAVTVVKDISISVPPGFKIDSTTDNTANLLNEKSSECINIKCVDKNPYKSFAKSVSSFESKNNAKPENLSNKSVEHVQFKDTGSGQFTSFLLFEKENHFLTVKLSNYTDASQLEKDMNYLIDNMVHDFKQNK